MKEENQNSHEMVFVVRLFSLLLLTFLWVCAVINP